MQVLEESDCNLTIVGGRNHKGLWIVRGQSRVSHFDKTLETTLKSLI